jgi:hypothetical protein
MRPLHATIAVCVVLSLLAVWMIVREGGQQANRLVESIAHGGGRTVSESFREYLVAVRAAKGDELLVAEVAAVNEIARSDTRREFWTGLSLGTTTVSIRYPVTYRYAVRISDPWLLRVSGDIVLVRRPQLRPIEPAIDTRGLDIHSANGWLRWNQDDERDRLLQQLTPDAIARASEHAATARPHADSAVAAFVRGWLLAASGIAPRNAQVVMVDAIEGGTEIRAP